MPSTMHATVEKQRAVQEEVASADRSQSTTKEEKPPQTGARQYPVPPFPKQHQPKPGSEARLDPEPMYDAPFYIGSGKLEGKVALITGADSGIGRLERLYRMTEPALRGRDIARRCSSRRPATLCVTGSQVAVTRW